MNNDNDKLYCWKKLMNNDNDKIVLLEEVDE